MNNWKQYNDLMNEGEEGYNPYYHPFRNPTGKQETKTTQEKKIIYNNKPFTASQLTERLAEEKVRLEKVTDSFAKELIQKNIKKIEILLA